MNVNYANQILVAAAATLGIAAQTQAFELNQLTTRVRALYIEPADKSDAISALAVPKNSTKF